MKRKIPHAYLILPLIFSLKHMESHAYRQKIWDGRHSNWPVCQQSTSSTCHLCLLTVIVTVTTDRTHRKNFSQAVPKHCGEKEKIERARTWWWLRRLHSESSLHSQYPAKFSGNNCYINRNKDIINESIMWL